MSWFHKAQPKVEPSPLSLIEEMPACSTVGLEYEERQMKAALLRVGMFHLSESLPVIKAHVQRMAESGESYSEYYAAQIKDMAEILGIEVYRKE